MAGSKLLPHGLWLKMQLISKKSEFQGDQSYEWYLFLIWLSIFHHAFRVQGTPSDQDSKTQRWFISNLIWQRKAANPNTERLEIQYCSWYFCTEQVKCNNWVQPNCGKNQLIIPQYSLWLAVSRLCTRRSLMLKFFVFSLKEKLIKWRKEEC